MTNFTTEICRTHFFVGLRTRFDGPDVSAPLRPWSRINHLYEHHNMLHILHKPATTDSHSHQHHHPSIHKFIKIHLFIFHVLHVLMSGVVSVHSFVVVHIHLLLPLLLPIVVLIDDRWSSVTDRLRIFRQSKILGRGGISVLQFKSKFWECKK